jgi:murein DD-endopeptidase MepM/ murein hydrolase activator NlpD
MHSRKLIILAQNAWASLPKKPFAFAALLLGLPAFSVLTAFGIAPDTRLENIERREIVEFVTLSDPTFADASLERFNYQDKVQRGDSVAAILTRLHVDDRRAFDFLRRSPDARSLFQLRPGKSVQATTDSAGSLLGLRYLNGGDTFLEVTRDVDRFKVSEPAYSEAPQRVFKTATIRSSLFAATDNAGIPDAIAMQVARIFSTDIDFHIDLRKGDRLAVVYEMQYQDGELIRPGRVLSAEFTNAGKTYDAYLFTGEAGSESYYSHDGENRAKSFLRSPLEFSRVSSGFGSRLHPIFRNWRAHTGADFAAPKGTRIWTTADGRVEFTGAKGGYGNCIEIRHSGGITTLYGHLSGIARDIRRGTRVKQGEVIGYVGATGWATGPHLHYEFRIAGIHHDPLRVALPKAAPLPESLRPAFRQVAAQGNQQLTLLRAANFSRFE